MLLYKTCWEACSNIYCVDFAVTIARQYPAHLAVATVRETLPIDGCCRYDWRDIEFIVPYCDYHNVSCRNSRLVESAENCVLFLVWIASTRLPENRKCVEKRRQQSIANILNVSRAEVSNKESVNVERGYFRNTRQVDFPFIDS